jgi:hypothetical protein
MALPSLETTPLRPPVTDGPLPLRKFHLAKSRSRFSLWRRNGKLKANE